MQIDDALFRTDRNTGAAGSALTIVDSCKIISHMNGIIWTGFFATHTRNASDSAKLIADGTLFGRATQNMYPFVDGHKLD
jgi:hypothetical protein